MNKLKDILKEHKFAIALAILTSIIIALPQVYFRIDHRDDGIYQGIELLPDSPWSARTREVQDGHPNFGAIYYKDGKELPYLFQPLGSVVVGYMGKLFSLNINDTLLLSRLVWPLVVSLLIYGFVLLVSRDKFVALSSAAVLLLADSVLSVHGITQLLQGISPDYFVRLARPVNPAMIYVFFFGFLLTFWQFYRQRHWWYGAASVVLLGLNFYNYFYTWTYLYAFGGLLVLFFLIQRNWTEVLRIGSIFAGALLFAIPYILNLYRASLHPAYEEAGIRFGMVLSREPLFVGFVVLGALALFLWKFPREDKGTYFFGLALLLAPFVTMNQQLITGRVLQEAHYHWFFHKPIGAIFVLITIFSVLTIWGLGRYKKLFAAAIIAVSVFVGVFTQIHSYAYDPRDGGDIAIERQRYGPIMNWLNANATKEAVVFGNDESSHITVIYTPLNVFYHRASIYSLAATKERLQDVLFAFYRLRGVTREDAREVFFEERGYISANTYGIYYRELLGSYDSIPNEKIEEILARYEGILSIPTAQWLQDTWARYDVEYVIWDKTLDPEWQLEQYPFLEEATVFDDLALYRFVSEPETN